MTKLKNVLTGQELLSMQIKEFPTLVKPIFPKVGIVAIAGSSDTGKSTLLRQLAIAISTKAKDFLGFPINATHNSALYITTEDDENAISYLLTIQKEGLKLDNKDFGNLRYLFDEGDVLDQIDQELSRIPADIVIIDAFADLFEGEMNASNKVRSFLNKYSRLAKKFDCLVIFLHHTGKRTEELPPSKNNLLGSQGFEAKMRMVIELRKDLKDSNIRHLCIVKGNYLKDEFKEDSFALTFGDDMLFTNTSKRIPFKSLVKETKKENTDAKNRAKELKGKGMPYREISLELQKEGFRGIGKSTIGEWLKDCPSVQYP